MKTLVLFTSVVLILGSASITRANNPTPDLSQLKLVAQLPPELPQRVMGLAYDGEQLWATIYLGRGAYAKLNPETLVWTIEEQKERRDTIAQTAGAFSSPGGISFQQDSLWIAGSYGESFGSINRNTWKTERIFKGKLREDPASQSYSSIVHAGDYLWIAWHCFRYDLPKSQTQLLLKVDPQTGKVVAEYSAPGGTANDGTAGLTWDGQRLWYMKDKRLSAIDPLSGNITAQYVIAEIHRPSGLAWVRDALWITQFDGKVWRLPFAA